MPPWLLAVRKYRGLMTPAAFIGLMVVILVPLPTVVLDLLIVANIALSVVILMTTMYMKEPLDFSVFPSLLLGATLFRLVLNVATTRLILSADAGSPEEAMGVAGHVIATFAQFVAGSSLVVGVIIFLILIIVQFVVITKGATRISEVAARFTLDAMPGKQLAIDADLNAGIITEKEARFRRERIGQEADFFGAMDGASKFVRGDAVAGLIITAINVAGGLAIGVLEKGWPVVQSLETFTKLTIGDGLTSQIPAFVIAIASALIVTRSGSKEELGEQMAGQLISQPVGLTLTGVFLGVLTFTPLPTLPLLVAGGALIGTAWFMRTGVKKKNAAAASQAAAAAAKPEPPSPESLLKLDTMELEIGYGLVGLVDTNQGGDLLDRISAIRRQLVLELGIVMPPVRIRDNLQLQPTEYRVKVKGGVVARGQSVPGKFLAIDSGIASGAIEGEPTKEPAFNLPAWWIEPGVKGRAEALNYTVVDPASVLATHLTEVVRSSAPELLTRQEVNELIAQLKTKAPKLVDDTVGKDVRLSDLHRVLQNLLRERVGIRDMETIVETLSDWSGKTKDLDVLTEYVRNALRRSICQQYATPGEQGQLKLVCVTLDPAMEELIASYIDRSAVGTSLTMPAHVATRVAAQLAKGLGMVSAAGHMPVILASPHVRGVVRQIVEGNVPNAVVLGYNEIVAGVEVESLALVGPPESAQPATMSAA